MLVESICLHAPGSEDACLDTCLVLEGMGLRHSPPMIRESLSE